MNEDIREQIYDEEINPLMAQIIGICKEHNIPFLATFQLSKSEEIDGALLCTSCSLPDGTEEKIVRARDTIYAPVRGFTVITMTRKQEE